MKNMRNEKTGNYSWAGFYAQVEAAREAKGRGDQAAVDQHRRNVRQMGTRAMIRKIPNWMLKQPSP